jgi:tRNA 2-thiouridine synthesizing protein A
VNGQTVLDLRGVGCASVLIELAAEARSDATADRSVVVWTDDRGAPTELPAWCRMTGHRYVGPTDQPDQYQLILHPKETP